MLAFHRGLKKIVTITKLSSNNLIMEIVWSSFIHSFIIVHHAWISCVENTFDLWVHRMMQNSLIHMIILHLSTHLSMC
jgi:hypothetical protein